ncbi:multidrug effflux MFS transporter [Desulfobulbus rhabdoformis]|uniref:multidrug effflux MFS transporter n=1 Tax=Desulfobulbus rhabdoformis TaxID=34032 RepID=UPI0019653A3A|nr:multidrug effflux MFS transporter [Desulfobulbus rhabdoformis]MBM9613471.1 multidrug effflux MFS transporter [Desulfobulbus rhabdoformis]
MNLSTMKIIGLLTLLSAFPPLSTDMYLPALPLLQKLWNQPQNVVNLTLSGFFIGYCLSLLLYGPISDRFGRKPPLIVGVSLYVIASVLSGFVNDITSLIVLRVLQGIGSSSGVVISMAITKDLFTGRERQRILAYMAIIMALAPMLAPVIGGQIMTWLSWHWVFFVQALLGLAALGGVLRLQEPLREYAQGNVLLSMGRMYLRLLGNKKYVMLVVLFSIVVLPHFSFIGSAANIYIKEFGMSEQVFSYFFAFNAMAIMAGAFSCSKMQKILPARSLLTIGFAGILVSGGVMRADIIPGPWGLALPMAIASFCFGLTRPTSNHLVLEQVDQGAGAASSLMVFLFFMMGAIAMWFIALDWRNTIHVIAMIALASGGGGLVLWLLLPGLSRSEEKGVAAQNR